MRSSLTPDDQRRRKAEEEANDEVIDPASFASSIGSSGSPSTVDKLSCEGVRSAFKGPDGCLLCVRLVLLPGDTSGSRSFLEITEIAGEETASAACQGDGSRGLADGRSPNSAMSYCPFVL